jgi:regulator of sigma E protease
MSILSSLFFFIVAIGLLIAIHEYGHFWVARKLGVKVLRYSIGFGKPLWMTRRGPDQTEYVVAAIPLGGYVRMLDEREGEVSAHELHRAFNRQPVAKRFAIVSAGPVFNFLLAIVAYWMVFVIGVTALKPIVGEVAPDSVAAHGGFAIGDVIVAVEGQPIDNWQSAVLVLLDKVLDDNTVHVKVRDAAGVEKDRTLDLKSVEKELKQGNMLDILGIQPQRPVIKALIGKLEPGEAAERAGMKVGDLVVSCDGRTIPGWEAWVECVRNHADQSIQVQVERNGEKLSLQVEPRLLKAKDGDHGYVGAGVALPQEGVDKQLLSVTRYSPLVALGKAADKTWEMSVLTLRMLWGMVDGRVSLSNISGPISIAKYAGYSAHIGGTAFLTFLAVISLSLGVLNLLPIPVLDGGHLFYYLIEIVKGSPVSDAAQALGQRIGIAALLILMVIALYNDLAQFID